MPNRDELASMTGESNYGRVQKRNYPELKLSGKTGKWEKTVKEGDQYINSEIEGDITGVILKIRRQLRFFKKQKGVISTLTTSEHNTPNDMAYLFETKERKTGKELRELHPELRTHQIIYMLVNGEIMRVIAKGSSLSPVEDKSSMSFYEYLSSFDKSGDVKEHAFEYQTILKPVLKSGDLGDYYSINFVRGQKLDDASLDIVAGEIKDLHNYFVAIDGSNDKPKEEESLNEHIEQPEPEEDLPVIQQGEDLIEETERAFPTPLKDEEINVDDIPF